MRVACASTALLSLQLTHVHTRAECVSMSVLSLVCLLSPCVPTHTCPSTPSMTHRNSGRRSILPTAKFLICHSPCRPQKNKKQNTRHNAVRVCAVFAVCAVSLGCGRCSLATNKRHRVVDVRGIFLTHGAVLEPVVCWQGIKGARHLRWPVSPGSLCSGRLQAREDMHGTEADKSGCGM
jgi:hypothetical protein